MDTRDHFIAAQNAATAAATIYAELIRNGSVASFDAGEFEGIREVIFTGSLSRAEEAGVAQVQAGFAPAQAAPIPQGYAPAPSAPAAPEPFPPAQVAIVPQAQYQQPVQQPQQQYQAPQVPQQQYQPAPPPPPGPSSPAAAGGAPLGACPKCGGQTYDNRAENNQKRAGNFALGPDFKCRNKDCGGCVWPADFEQYRNFPKMARR